MPTFKVLGINHIGLAPKNPQKAAHLFKTLFGLAHLGDELVKDQMVMTKMFASSNSAKSDAARLEILENEGGLEGPIAKFLEKRGGGIHHIALNVDNIENAIATLKAQKVRLIDETPRKGAHNTRIAFLHPEAAGGLLIELVEEQKI